jgi:hypothetical protein
MHRYALQDQNSGHNLIFAEARAGQQVMARSRNRKRLGSLGGAKPRQAPQGHENLFFDLDKDPQEMNNLYDSPRYYEDINTIKAALSAWRTKDTKPRAYQDHNAPKISQPNVPPHDPSHREAIIRYYRKKMLTLQGLT